MHEGNARPRQAYLNAAEADRSRMRYCAVSPPLSDTGGAGLFICSVRQRVSRLALALSPAR
jgi:hypothetical protein